jgi:hypothetical protein
MRSPTSANVAIALPEVAPARNSGQRSASLCRLRPTRTSRALRLANAECRRASKFACRPGCEHGPCRSCTIFGVRVPRGRTGVIAGDTARFAAGKFAAMGAHLPLLFAVATIPVAFPVNRHLARQTLQMAGPWAGANAQYQSVARARIKTCPIVPSRLSASLRLSTTGS